MNFAVFRLGLVAEGAEGADVSPRTRAQGGVGLLGGVPLVVHLLCWPCGKRIFAYLIERIECKCSAVPHDDAGR